MLRLRDVAKRALGVTGAFSVNRDVYGYPWTDASGLIFGALTATSDSLPGTGQLRTRSLRKHLQTISGPAFDLTVIWVGHEPGFAGTFTRAQAARTQYALQVARDIYAQAQLGIRRLDWRYIPVAQAGTAISPKNRATCKNLTDAWSGPAGTLDLFVVQNIGDADGWSHDVTDCNKNDNADLSGAVAEINRTDNRFVGILWAHEVGHALGLAGGTDGQANLMGSDTNADGVDEIGNNSTGLTSAQAKTMRQHCPVTTAIW